MSEIIANPITNQYISPVLAKYPTNRPKIAPIDELINIQCLVLNQSKFFVDLNMIRYAAQKPTDKATMLIITKLWVTPSTNEKKFKHAIMGTNPTTPPSTVPINE